MHSESSGRDSLSIVVLRSYKGTLPMTGTAAIVASATFALVSIVWQHVIAVATVSVIRSMAGNGVQVTIGTGSMLLGWFCFGLLAITSMLAVVKTTIKQPRGSGQERLTL